MRFLPALLLILMASASFSACDAARAEDPCNERLGTYRLAGGQLLDLYHDCETAAWGRLGDEALSGVYVAGTLYLHGPSTAVIVDPGEAVVVVTRFAEPEAVQAERLD